LFYLLNPIWLLAASGIIIPIAIHLWNVKQGKTLKIGSLKLLARTEQARARSLRLTELFLLLLRCILILLLALLLAKPYWQNPSAKKGWVLMEQKDAPQAYEHFKPLVDSLLQAGYTFHLFDKGFEEKDLQTIVKDTADESHHPSASYWQLVKDLDKQLLPGMPVYIFTGNRLNRFHGKRHDVAIAVTWKTFTAKDSASRFISDAYIGANDSVIITMGETNPAGTRFHQQVIATNQPKQNDFSLDVSNGSLQLSYHNSEPVPVDTATWHITIFANAYFNDTRYVKAAIQSIQQVTKRRIELKLVNAIAQVPAKQDWLFWLSDQAIPSQINASNILRYQAGTAIAVRSRLLAKEAGIGEETGLYKRVPCTAKNPDIVWQDGFGEPLLTKEQDGPKAFYRFYTHFDPSWNELAWNASFPQLIYGLMDTADTNKSINRNDQRVIDDQQLQLAVSTKKKEIAAIKNNEATDLKQVLWGIIFMLFCLERFFSLKTKKEKASA
jgi:hypothetical protein